MRQVLIAGADLGTAALQVDLAVLAVVAVFFATIASLDDPPRGRMSAARPAGGRPARDGGRGRATRATGSSPPPRARSASSASRRRRSAAWRRGRASTPPWSTTTSAPSSGSSWRRWRFPIDFGGAHPARPRRPPGGAGQAHRAARPGALGLAGDASPHARDRPFGRDGPGRCRHVPPASSPRARFWLWRRPPTARMPTCERRSWGPSWWAWPWPAIRQGRADRVGRPRAARARDRRDPAAAT